MTVKVVVVGMGPGDPDLLTLKAEDALAAADVVVTGAVDEVMATTADLVAWCVPGDPYLDGGAVTGVAALLERGYEVEVVPGVGMAMAAAAETLTPLTTRHRSPWVTIVPESSGQ